MITVDKRKRIKANQVEVRSQRGSETFRSFIGAMNWFCCSSREDKVLESPMDREILDGFQRIAAAGLLRSDPKLGTATFGQDFTCSAPF